MHKFSGSSHPIAERKEIFDLEYNYPDAIKSFDLKLIDLFASEKINGSKMLFQQSGMRSILKCLFTELGEENLDSILFEFVKLKVDEKPLDFTCYWASDEREAIIRKEKVEQNLVAMHKVLLEERTNIFYHQGFFAMPLHPTVYYSYVDQIWPYIYESSDNLRDPKIKTFIQTQLESWKEKIPKHKSSHEMDPVQTDDLGKVYVSRLPSNPTSYQNFLDASHNESIGGLPVDDPKYEKGVAYLHALLHLAFNTFLLKEENAWSNTLFCSIPLLAMPADKKQKEGQKEGEIGFIGQGALFLFINFKGDYKPEETEFRSSDFGYTKIERLIGLITDISKDITYNYLLEEGLSLAKVAQENALKSAFASIVSRNGSHNLGSHVLASLVGGFQELPDLHNIITYLQERFDFLALITTDFPDWTYPVRFVHDLMHRFFKQRLLLNYIADTENLHAFEYQTRNPQLKQQGFLTAQRVDEELEEEEEKLILNVHIRKKGQLYKIVTKENLNDHIQEDIELAIPGGIVGYHAIYVILENIIRNASKYGWGAIEDRTTKRNLEITIEVEEIEESGFVEVKIWDNVSKITRNPGDKENLVNVMNKSLCEEFIERDGSMRMRNLGLAEIRIAAGFLNHIDRIDIGGDKSEKILYKRITQNGINTFQGFITAYAQESEDGNYLGYKFPVPKPKEILFTGEPGVNDIDIPFFRSNLNVEPGRHYYDSDIVVINELYDKPDSVIQKILDCQFEEEEVAKLSPEKLSALHAIINELDRYPGRIVLVSDTLFHAKKRRKLPKILRKRGLFLSQEKFNKLLREGVDKLYLQLYKYWIGHLKFVRGKEIFEYDLELNIALTGAKTEPRKEIFKYIFQQFKLPMADSCLPSSNWDPPAEILDDPALMAEYLDIIERLKQVNFHDIHPKNIENRFDEDHFIQNWIRKACDWKYPYRKVLTQRLEDVFYHYELMGSVFHLKYQERIETVPRIYQANDAYQYRRGGGNDPMKGREEFHTLLNKPITWLNDKPAKGTKKIFYDRHQNRIDKDLIYSEAISGSQIYYSVLNNIPNSDDERNKFYYQLVENGLLRILIIDERIHSYYEEKGMSRLLSGNIHIPLAIYFEDIAFGMSHLKKEKWVDYSKEIFVYERRPDRKSVLDQGEAKIIQKYAMDGEGIGNFEVIIIHQGILDKMFENDIDKRDRFIQKCKLEVPYVAVTTGRGQPENLPKDTKIISFSNLQAFFMTDYPEKLLFTQVLMKAASTSGSLSSY